MKGPLQFNAAGWRLFDWLAVDAIEFRLERLVVFVAIKRGSRGPLLL
jgi:hypothetical protein